MKRSLFIAPLMMISLPLAANDALDILEGKKDINEIELPPLPEEEATQRGDQVTFVPPEWAPSPLDPIWSRAVLYEDNSNPWVQQLAVMGLFEAGGSWGTAQVNGGRDVDLSTTRTRRARLGARMRAFGNTEIEAVAEFAGDEEYKRIVDLKAKTQVRPNYYLSYGKMRPRFGIEQSKDPQQLLTPERTLLANMLSPASTLGVSLSQECAPWDWSIGWFSSDQDRYIPGIQGSGFLAGSLAYETGEALSGGGAMRSRWHLDYIYNMDGDKSRSIPRYNVAGDRSANGNQVIARNPSFRHMLSTGIQLEGELFAFEGDFQLANGDVNAWGLTLTPSYWAVPGLLKVVGRYHYADTDEPSALVGGLGTGSDPFFDSSPIFVGDEFHSFYLGANLHLYQDKLVLQNGLEYSLMNDDANGFETDAWVWHASALLSF
ncbi:porin [Haloferula sp.]|uniref:porin n=1 Tax=Haloferula sp. TaxID=2497595 RepID=UPI003C7425DC